MYIAIQCKLNYTETVVLLRYLSLSQKEREREREIERERERMKPNTLTSSVTVWLAKRHKFARY